MPSDLPREFADELGAAFRRLVPQGTPAWGFASAIDRVRRALIGGVALGPPHPDDLPAGGPGSGGHRGGVRDRAERMAGPWVEHQARVAARQVLDRSAGPALARAGEALEAMAESLRFLAARIERLEAAAGRSRSPVADLAALAPAPDLAPWAPTVSGWLGPAPARGPRAVVAECGDGALAAALAQDGWKVTAADPRAPSVLAAHRRGVRAQVAEAADVLGTARPGTLGAVVLAGAVDRSPLVDVVALAELALDRLAQGGALVVVCGDAAAWRPAALDLAAGRPLRPETWEHLLGRAGCSDIRSARGGDAPQEGAAGWAVGGRR